MTETAAVDGKSSKLHCYTQIKDGEIVKHSIVLSINNNSHFGVSNRRLETQTKHGRDETKSFSSQRFNHQL
jgi:hypothetical protein